MSNIEIKHLFRTNRLPDNDVKLLLFILFLPFGLVFFLLRIILILSLFILGYVVSDTGASQKILNKIATLAFGISVSIENPKKKENVDMYVSNSMSIFDHLAVNVATGAVAPGTKVSLEKILGTSTYYFGSVANFDAFKKNICQFISEKKIPLYFTPEGKLTNGKALIKFKSYPFQFATKIQPICITVERPFLNISVTTLGSSYFSDVFFFMFSPLTNYRLNFLTPLEKENHSDSEFAEVVRQSIATALKIETVDYTSSELIEWEKRKIAENQQRLEMQNSSRSVLNSELQRMSLQVREVLPHVPFTAVYNDLYTTRNVDNTITNILEGRVHFIPEQSTKPSTSSQSTSSTSSFSGSAIPSSSFMFNTAASTFAKSASERSKSFKERKEQLIANARKRYIEKHNLNIPI
uniref:Lipid droplet-regulating VLDL assembly factor AUP1 n=1 Tax=Anoplophora glabripennis TaxID=217634 RepID=V5GFZ1_ANOGL